MLIYIIGIAVSIMLIVLGYGSFLNTVCLLVWCALLVMSVLFTYSIPKKVFRQDPKFQDEYNLTFSHDEIKIVTDHAKSTMSWNNYSHIKENAHFFYLIYGKGKYVFSVIPKRVFESKKEEDAFRKLIHEKIGQAE